MKKFLYKFHYFAVCALLICFGTMSRSAVAQATVTIAAPQPGDSISGSVAILGSATSDDFLRYEIAFQQGEADWVVFVQNSEQVTDGELATWETTTGRDVAQPTFPDGTYTLRLRVVKNDNSFEEAFAGNIVVLNGELEATPDSEAGETPTPEEVGLPTVEVESAVNDDEPVATLTPFAADPPEDDTSVPEEEQRDAPSEDPLLVAADSIESLDYSRFGRAFLFGIRIAVGIFAVFLGYLLLRNTLRKLWWFVTTKLFR